MDDKTYNILTLNPGSTSTKVALYRNEEAIALEIIRHKPEDFKDCIRIMDQKEVRTKLLLDFLNAKEVDPSGLDAVVGRGGLVKPIDSGTYRINEKMLRDLSRGSAGMHASSLGGIIAAEIGERYGIPAYIVDPVVVDEMAPVAKLSGIPGIERRSVFHALNTKAVARACAEKIGIRYEDGRFIVAHMGGGISVGAHQYGCVIDVNDALSGEGPFTPERSGSVPLVALIEMCYGGQYTKEEMIALVTRQGGVLAYLGTSDMVKVEKMIKNGDEYAALVMDAMAYQVCKTIGAMAVVLGNQVNAIILTGGLAHSLRFTGEIKRRVDQMAPVITYPGENEMAALAQGALRILQGKEKSLIYQ